DETGELGGHQRREGGQAGLLGLRQRRGRELGEGGGIEVAAQVRQRVRQRGGVQAQHLRGAVGAGDHLDPGDVRGRQQRQPEPVTPARGCRAVGGEELCGGVLGGEQRLPGQGDGLRGAGRSGGGYHERGPLEPGRQLRGRVE